MILVTGASGNVGRPLVTQLLARGAKVRAVSRHADAAGMPDGAEVVQADPSRPESLDRCFDGVTAIFLNARAVRTAASKVLALAKRAGVVRAVALAAGNVDEDHARQPSRWRGDLNAELEQAVIASGLEWVSLRPNEYASNYLGLWAAQLRSGNVIRAPYGASQHAPIDERDIAAVAVDALLTDRLLRQKVPLTGPRSQSARELADTLAEALGRPIRFEEVPPEAARQTMLAQTMLAQGLPEGFVTGYLLLQAEAVDRPPLVTHTVEEIVGRPATDFATWAADHAESFRGIAA
jgi:uncharacterized protein YbjT (DUF2867 family)